MKTPSHLVSLVLSAHAQSLTVSRAAVVDCTLPSTRIRPMARLGATVGAGFVIGPVRLIARFAIDSDT